MRFHILLIFSLASFPCLSQTPAKQSAAANIRLRSISGDTLELEALRGKVVLVDFWASWCRPCRVSNRNLVALYEKYHPAGFEIFSVSIDADTVRWRNAVIVDKMGWLQVNHPGAWEAPVVKEWGIWKLPSSFLINKDGMIISTDPTYGVLNKWLEDLLITNNNSK